VRRARTDVSIFVSYAHGDPPLFRDMLVALLKWPRVSVTVWTDEKVEPGSDWDKQVRAALEDMHIFVPLVSPLFAASSYIQEVEVRAARRRHEEKKIAIAPVVVSHPGGITCDWLMRLEPLPHKVKSWSEIRKESLPTGGYDEALKPLRDGVWKLVERVRESGLAKARV